MEKKEYSFSADLIRAFAIVGVIVIHTLNAVFARPDFFGGFYWWVSIVLNSLSRASIPFFILLSGYFILAKSENYRQTLTRTVSRIVVPLILWEIIYLIWSGGHPTLRNLGLNIFVRFLRVNVFDLYFLIILLGLYLISPVLRNVLAGRSSSSQKKITLGVLSLNIAQVILLFVQQRCGNATIFTYFLPYVGLFMAGYVFGTQALSQKMRGTLLVISMLSLAATVAGNYLYYSAQLLGHTSLFTFSCLSHYTDYYMSINVVLFSISAFLLLLKHPFTLLSHSVVGKYVRSVATCSFAIYLLHPFVMDILDRHFRLFDHIPFLWLYIPIKLTVIFLVSYGCAWLMLRISLSRYLFGLKTRPPLKKN